MISSPDSGEQEEFINGWVVHHLPVQEFLISEEEERTEEVEEKERQSPTTSSDMASGDLALEEFFRRSQHCSLEQTATKPLRRWQLCRRRNGDGDGGQFGHKQKRCLSMYGQKITTSGTGSKVTSIAHVSLQEKSTTVIPTRSSSHHEKQSDGSHTTSPKPATNKDDTPQTCDEVSTPDPCLEAIK
ncbi:hypothetical protein Bca4012_044975 [Brassica carinata]